MPRLTLRSLRPLLLCLGVSLALSIGSFGIQRHGPEMGEVGDGCGPAADQPCYLPLLTGGWPLGYLIDRPEVSVPDKLGFEDRLRPELFAADVVFYFGLFALTWRYGRMRRRLRAEAHARDPAP